MTASHSVASLFPIPEKEVVVIASLTATLALALLACSLITGGSHLAFQFVRPVQDYAALLVARGSQLRLELALDYVFLCAYSVLMVLVNDVLRKWSGGDARLAHLPVWLLLLLGSAVFDIL